MRSEPRQPTCGRFWARANEHANTGGSAIVRSPGRNARIVSAPLLPLLARLSARLHRAAVHGRKTVSSPASAASTLSGPASHAEARVIARAHSRCEHC